MRPKDPIWRILKHQRRDYVWLAERTGYSHSYVKAAAVGQIIASREFRAKCAFALDMPEDLLFLPLPSEMTATA